MLVPACQEVLAAAKLNFADLDAIVVGCGPGPFTGLRVGMATAAAFGQALNIPVYGVCTHDALAWAAHEESPVSDSFLVATDARRREIYWARYDFATAATAATAAPTAPTALAARTHGPAVNAPANLDTPYPEKLVIPEALFAQLPAPWQEIPRLDPKPSAAGLVAVADFSEPNPGPLEALYLRRPDAVPPPPIPRSKALPEIVPPAEPA